MPGQQAVIKAGEVSLQVRKVNTDAVTAWIRNKFPFQGADIQDIMRQLARWYDVQVIYDQGLPSSEHTFGGSIDRNITLRALLPRLENMTGYRFTMQGKTVHVSIAMK